MARCRRSPAAGCAMTWRRTSCRGSATGSRSPRRRAPTIPPSCITCCRGAPSSRAELAGHLRPGHTVALIGSSGVGKSSLVNRWLERDAQTVAPTDDNDRGRHATTRRELFALPGGGLVIDTPGMRIFGLLDTDTGLAEAFADIAAL